MRARPVNTENVREEGVNVHLAQLLRNRGVSARAERRSREGAPDVRADLRSGDLVILECKWEESSGLLEGQLDGRLSDFPDALGLLGVLYPARLRQEEDTQAALGVGGPTCGGGCMALAASQSVSASLGPARLRTLPTICELCPWSWKA